MISSSWRFAILCRDVIFWPLPPIPFQSISYYSAFSYFQHPVVSLHVVEMTKWQLHWGGKEEEKVGEWFSDPAGRWWRPGRWTWQTALVCAHKLICADCLIGLACFLTKQSLLEFFLIAAAWNAWFCGNISKKSPFFKVNKKCPDSTAVNKLEAQNEANLLR